MYCTLMTHITQAIAGNVRARRRDAPGRQGGPVSGKGPRGLRGRRRARRRPLLLRDPGAPFN